MSQGSPQQFVPEYFVQSNAAKAREAAKIKKKTKEATFRTDARGFADVVTALIIGHRVLTKLKIKMAKGSAGANDLILGAVTSDKKGAEAYASMPGINEPFRLNKATLNELEAGYIAALQDLKKYYAVAKKRQNTKPLKVEEFRGIHGPTVVGPNITNFLYDQKAKFGPRIDALQNGEFQPATDGGLLIDSFPELIQEALAIRNTVVNLFYVYFNFNKLTGNKGKNYRADGGMSPYFDQNLPLFASGQGRPGKDGKIVFPKFADGEFDKEFGINVRNDQSTFSYLVNQGVKQIPSGYNEDGSRKYRQTQFSPSNFGTSDISSIVSLNSKSIKDMTPEEKRNAESNTHKAAMFREYHLAQYAKDYWASQKPKVKATTERTKSPKRAVRLVKATA